KPPMFASKIRLISSSCAITASRPSSVKASTRSSSDTGSLLTKRIAWIAARSSVASIIQCLSVIEKCEAGLVDLVLRPGQQNFTEGLALLQADSSEAHQLQRAEEDGDELVTIAPFQKPLQADRRLLLQFRVQLGHLLRAFVNRVLELQRLGVILLVAVERRAECVDQIEERHLAHVALRGLVAGERRLRARPHAHAYDIELGERFRNCLESLVLEQPVHQLLARILDRLRR